MITNLLTEEEKRKSIDEIITFLDQEHDLEIGIIAAEKMLDFFLENTGKKIYKKGIENSTKLLKKRFEEIEFELEELKE